MTYTEAGPGSNAGTPDADVQAAQAAALEAALSGDSQAEADAIAVAVNVQQTDAFQEQMTADLNIMGIPAPR